MMPMLETLSARMFNWSASRASRQPDRILAALQLKKGAAVADFGSGGGYYVQRFAMETGPEGKVFAVDINPEFLRFIDRNARRAGLGNIVTMPVAEVERRIPAGSLDLIFCRDVYHHLSDRPETFRRLALLLRPDGRVAIIDWLPDAGRLVGPPAGHRTSSDKMIAELYSAGLSVIQKLDFMKGQSFLIFGPAGSDGLAAP